MSIELLYGMAALLAIGIIVIGIRFLLWPGRAAADFGLAAGGSIQVRPWLQAKGVRDIASGIAGIAFVYMGNSGALGLYLICASFVPAGDTLIVLAHEGGWTRALGVHGLTAIVLVTLGISLLLR